MTKSDISTLSRGENVKNNEQKNEGHYPATPTSVLVVHLNNRSDMAVNFDVPIERLDFSESFTFVDSCAKLLKRKFDLVIVLIDIEISEDKSALSVIKQLANGSCLVVGRTINYLTSNNPLLHTLPQIGQEMSKTNSLIISRNFVRVGALTADTESEVIYVHGKLVNFTITEHKMLWSMLRAPNNTVTKEKLGECLRRASSPGVSAAVRVYIYRLRQIFLLNNSEVSILRVPGGYALQAESQGDSLTRSENKFLVAATEVGAAEAVELVKNALVAEISVSKGDASR